LSLASRTLGVSGSSTDSGGATRAQRGWLPRWLEDEFCLYDFMIDDLTTTTLATWAARNLPARLDVTATAKLLGFGEPDIQILMAVGKLIPLGDPAPNAPKWFASIEIIRLATDHDWLHKATKEIAKHWQRKRSRHVNVHFTKVDKYAV
jgi:hypothetical protein